MIAFFLKWRMLGLALVWGIRPSVTSESDKSFKTVASAKDYLLCNFKSNCTQPTCVPLVEIDRKPDR